MPPGPGRGAPRTAHRPPRSPRRRNCSRRTRKPGPSGRRLPHNLRTLQSLLTASAATFKTLRRTTSASGRQRVRRTLLRQLHKAIRLTEELSPRTELLERLSEDLVRWSERLNELEREIAG